MKRILVLLVLSLVSSVSFAAQATSIHPPAGYPQDIGTSALPWKNIYYTGKLYLNGTDLNVSTMTAVNIYNSTTSLQNQIYGFKVSPSTGINNGQIANGVKITTANITATGTPTDTSYLSGDGSWKTPSGFGDMFLASTQTVTAPKNFNSTYASTFTALNVTNLTVSNFSTVNDGIYQLIYSTSGILTSSFTITGLDGNVDKEYYIVFAGTASVTDSLKMFYNGDTTTTNYAYANQYVSGGFYKFDGGNRADYINIAESGFYAITTIRAKTGMYRMANTLCSATASASTMQSLNMMAHQWENTTDNITSMTFYTNTGVPTIYIRDFSIYARR